jgi:acetoacetyl-CoA synthetase
VDLGHCPKVDGSHLDRRHQRRHRLRRRLRRRLRTLPVVKGEMQCRCLGAAVEAWSEAGRAADRRGRRAGVHQPMPSMPLYFWGDTRWPRYRDSYFDMYPGGRQARGWRHGDWIRITPRGRHGAIIYGRSDATINRHGVRMGTAELYRAVEALPEVLDSLVVDLEYLGRESWMPLFVVLREGLVLDERCASASRPSARRCRRATCPTTSSRWPPCRARCRARRWSCR